MTRYTLRPGTLRVDGGRVVIGGTPLAVLHLSERGAEVLAAVLRGDRPDGSGAVALVERFIDRGILEPWPEPTDLSPIEALDLVVPVRDDVDGLGRTLASIRDGRAAIVVVDDGSRDHAAVAALARRHGAAVLRHEWPRGPAAARDTGAAAGGASWICFVDAGVELPEGWVDGLGRHVRGTGTAVVAPRVASLPGPTTLDRYEVACSPLDLGPRPAPVRPGGAVAYVPTAAVLVRRAAFEAVGGFDERLRYGEDVDLVWRLVADGWECRYAGDSVVAWHRPRSTWPALARQRFGYGTAAAALDERHPGAVAPVAASRWTLAVAGLVAGGQPVPAVGLGALTAWLLRRKLPVRDRGATAARLVAVGHYGGLRQMARALVRPWWPLTAIASLCSRRVRRLLPVAVLATAAERFDRRAGIPLWQWVAARLLDDGAFAAGVWAGALRARRAGSLLPRWVEWPGRTSGRGVRGGEGPGPASRPGPR